ncbi:MAG TPA: hypothetical protein EYQ14_22505 [Gammaproteobacteria bacterium]|nr:hypothetical protein [Gammaproteobacteria bacterium]HIL96197.1 hypothetical protein [Pseudomonadales bacterium]
MTYKVLGEFIETMRKAGEDDAVRVVILTGTPPTFCESIRSCEFI